MLSDEYIAGFFDGEGSINIQFVDNKPCTVHVQISQNDRNILLQIQDKHGGKMYGNWPHNPRTNRLDFSGHGALSFLLSIKAYLVVKKKQAELAIKYINIMRKHGGQKGNPITRDEMKNRINMANQMKCLNSVNGKGTKGIIYA